MSRHFAETGEYFQPVFKEDMTKQAFKDDADINKILARFKKTGVVTHLSKYQAHYGDLTGDSLQEAIQRVELAHEIFNDLPSEIRSEFNQDPAAYLDFVNDPANADRLDQVLPQINQPGAYFPDVSRQTPPDATLEPTPGPAAADQVPETPADPPAT